MRSLRSASATSKFRSWLGGINRASTTVRAFASISAGHPRNCAEFADERARAASDDRCGKSEMVGAHDLNLASQNNGQAMADLARLG